MNNLDQYKYIETGIAERIATIDTTNREGYQACGMDWRPEDSIALIQLMDNFGVSTIEMNHPGSSDAAAALLWRARNAGLVRARQATHVRIGTTDFDQAIVSPVDDIHAYLGMDIYGNQREQVARAIQIAREAVPNASEAGKNVRLSIEHTFRMDRDIALQAYYEMSRIPGIMRVGVAETTGTMRPSQFRQFITELFEVVPLNIPIGLHAHNDIGVAGGNSADFMEMLALAGRTGAIDFTVGGIGERNGPNSMGDVFSQLLMFDPEGTKDRYNLQTYAHIHHLFSQITGQPISRRDPLSEFAFGHKSGPHLEGVLKHADRYQVLSPELLGHELILEFGSKITGWYAIQYYAANQMGLSLDKAQAAAIAKGVREIAFEAGTLQDEQLQQVIYSLAQSTGVELQQQYAGVQFKQAAD